MKNKNSKLNLSRTRVDSFSSINEKPVDDISLQFFYNPHTITLLLTSIGATDRQCGEQHMGRNIMLLLFFLIISVLAFPNGPFTRPHPAIWRMVFGMSVLYLLGCLFILFQNYHTVKNILYWF
ncbi:hypothetical protein NQ318_014288 [Aromia moschata]|uniref:Phosphatidylserine synthase n=1 Tax=Aromia moschata TaxID=1265417 RepID=A0AAV8Z0H7_9CUCU|nr:hypothetical protein NQ318_014288 [Aromia moschata]